MADIYHHLQQIELALQHMLYSVRVLPTKCMAKFIFH